MNHPVKSIDLNCDLGESDTGTGVLIERQLLEIISSANIACGGHAGDPHTMLRTVTTALSHNVALGAHPGYPDLANFGRISIPMSPAEIESACFKQITALAKYAHSLGGHLNHIKPHGALYHDAMVSEPIALAIGRAALRINPKLVMIGFPNALALRIWQGQGFKVATEAFADRTYEPDGSLRKRTLPGALITDPAAAVAQSLRLATSTTPPDTLCIHSDTTNAPEIAAAIRTALSAAGFAIKAPGAS